MVSVIPRPGFSCRFWQAPRAGSWLWMARTRLVPLPDLARALRDCSAPRDSPHAYSFLFPSSRLSSRCSPLISEPRLSTRSLLWWCRPRFSPVLLRHCHCHCKSQDTFLKNILTGALRFHDLSLATIGPWSHHRPDNPVPAEDGRQPSQARSNTVPWVELPSLLVWYRRSSPRSAPPS